MPAPLPDLHISADHARRFLVRRHLLDPPRDLPAEPQSVLRVIDRLGSLQFDPLEVPGARNHDLVLHDRIAGYQREWCDRWLYGKDRRLIELYNKSLNILPADELPFYRLTWSHEASRYEDFLADHSSLVNRIRDHIRESGPVSTSTFRDVTDRIQWWWDSDAASTGTKAARAVMETMSVVGELGIARRDGSRRFYDLIERLVPARLLDAHATEAEQVRHRLLSRHRGVGLMGVGGAGELVLGTGKALERARITAELVEGGVLIPVAVEGFREARHVLANELPILEATAAPPAHAMPSASLLAPLDPLMWDRRLVKGLFGFDYIWEVYIPAAKRRHGYYVLPLLFADCLVGRIEPRYERVSRTLRIAGIWFEDGFSPMDEAGFLPALRDALKAYRSFVGARSVTWPRTRPGRDVAGALRRLSP
ncbi:MAG: winged helix DNA-binding domain-containing protein [Chloroflexota bacterium]|nr:winged helix DNA-binding domain-containing protein [Chloroflexota bacterium]